MHGIYHICLCADIEIPTLAEGVIYFLELLIFIITVVVFPIQNFGRMLILFTSSYDIICWTHRVFPLRDVHQQDFMQQGFVQTTHFLAMEVKGQV